MRHSIFANLFAVASAVLVSNTLHAADMDPIGRKIDNDQVMDRVALVGVIAGASRGDDGVAVIKDKQTGRTYAIKTGDSLPGVSHIKLQSVQRELAVFNADGKSFNVRLAIGGYAQEAEDEQDLAADLSSNSVPEGAGLFEKWYGNKLGAGADTVHAIDDNSATPSELTNTRKTEPVIIEIQNAPDTDESVELRRDKNGPVDEFLSTMTTTPDQKNKKRVTAKAEPKNTDSKVNDRPTADAGNVTAK